MLRFISLLVGFRLLQEICFDFGCIEMVLTLCVFMEFHGNIQIKMTSDASFMTSGYGAYFDMFMEKSRKNDIWCLIRVIWVLSLLWHFHGKTIKNDIGCCIHDIWVSSFFWHFPWKNPYKHDIGSLIPDIWVSGFFWSFNGKVQIKLASDA